MNTTPNGEDEASVIIDRAVHRYQTDPEFHAEVKAAVLVMGQNYRSLFDVSDLKRFVTQAAAVALELSHFGSTTEEPTDGR